MSKSTSLTRLVQTCAMSRATKAHQECAMPPPRWSVVATSLPHESVAVTAPSATRRAPPRPARSVGCRPAPCRRPPRARPSRRRSRAALRAEPRRPASRPFCCHERGHRSCAATTQGSAPPYDGPVRCPAPLSLGATACHRRSPSAATIRRSAVPARRCQRRHATLSGRPRTSRRTGTRWSAAAAPSSVLWPRLLVAHRTDETARPCPTCRESWKYNADGERSTSTCARGLKFSDGTPLDAAAVKANIERAKTQKNSALFGDLTSIKEVTTRKARRGRSTCRRSTTRSPSCSASGCCRSRAPKAAQDPRSCHQNPVGAGPFTVTQRVPGTQADAEEQPRLLERREHPHRQRAN